MGKTDKPEPYTEEEVQRRFLQSLKGAVNTPPKPLKSMTPKRPKKQSNKESGKIKTAR
jgi:hypothetical protein